MREHELRRQVVSEMHLRRWPVLSVPALVVQWVLIVDPDERAAETAYIAHIPTPHGAIDNPSHRSGALADGVHVTWERHSEGSSLALFFDGLCERELTAAAQPERVTRAIAWAQGLPGRLMRATQILVVPDDAAAKRVLPPLEFQRSELISCHIGGLARMWGDFRLQQDGFGRVVVAANGCDVRDFTRLVQRLQELGNYRNKALMGLPLAQNAWPRLDDVGQRLGQLAGRVADDAAKDDTLMEELSLLSLELTAVTNAIDYRMSATAAYAQLVRERLDQLRVEPIDGFASLDDFTQRRFLPAIRTCAAVTERERNLSARAERLASLLRARIDTRIENQNAELLRSMDRSARLQLRLQQLVEGLSVVALTYYLIGLIGYVVKGAGHLWPTFDPDVALGIIVMPVLALVWMAVRALKLRLLGTAA